MQNNLITRISPSIRLIILLILILVILIAKSIFLILFVTTLTILLFLTTGKKVNLYVKILKNILFLLLIFFTMYIIVFRNQGVISIFLFLYKLIIILIIITIFFLNSNFSSIHEGLYSLLFPLKKLNMNIEQISLDITFSMYFMKFIIESKEKIKLLPNIKTKKTLNISKYWLLRLVYSINELELLRNSLIIKFYKLNHKKSNLLSKIALVLFLLIFVVCIYKEVIL